MEMKSVWEYHLTAQAMCLGERNKKGTYRSTVANSIPYSQITGALRAKFGGGGQESNLHAVGRFKEPIKRQSLVRGLRDAATGISKLPIEADFLTDVVGVVYIAHNPYTQELPVKFQIRMGAFRSHGMGRCVLERKVDGLPNPVEPAIEGVLAVRLPDDAALLSLFGVTKVIAPVWGYLFRPDDLHEGGQYVRALFEGSRVFGPRILLGEGGSL
jgi:hypothetical protein